MQVSEQQNKKKEKKKDKAKWQSTKVDNSKSEIIETDKDI
jgi:hypothetical protein